MSYIGNETSNLDITVRAYYDRLALMTLEANAVLMDLCEKKPLPGKSGKTIYFTRYSNFSEVTSHLTEGVPPTVIQLSAVNVSASLVQDGYVTEISDLLDMTNITDNGKAAVERLAEQAGRSIDSFIRREIYNTAADSAVPVSANLKTVFGNDNSRGNVSAMQSTSCQMSTSVIRYATTSLKNLNAKPLQGEDFILVVNPTTAAKLRADSVWQNANQYSGVYAEKIFKGECGRIEGARVVETTQIPFFASSTAGNVFVSTADTSVTFSILLGKGAVGVTEMAGGIETFTVTGADKSDPLNQKTTYGWKITWTPKTLNASCGALVATTY
jgi:N4-gp56 family major capsid protein